MPARVFQLPYGERRIEISLDAELIAPRAAEPMADEAGAIREALRKPTGTPPLETIVRPGETVAIVVNDITRLARTDLVLPPIVEALGRAGVADEDITVFFALGNHRRQTEREQRRIVGEEMAARLRLVDHDAFDERNLVALGTTSRGNEIAINRAVWESDRIILTGEIVYHMIAGFSGGRKSLLPGVAGARSTTFNHSMIFDPRCTIGVLEGNPAHEDMLEACRMVAPDFIVNVMLTPSGSLAHVAAGHYEQAHREGCRQAERLFATPVEAPFDTVVASAGGHPLDTDLRQAHKGMENACRALAPGGTLVYYAECAHGIGIQPIVDFLVRYDTEEQMEQALRREFVVGGHKAYWLRRMGGKYRVRLVSDLDPRLVERCHFEPVPLAAHAGAVRDAARAGRVAVIPHAGTTLPVSARMI